MHDNVASMLSSYNNKLSRFTEVAPYATQEQKDQQQSDDDRLSRYYDCLNIWVRISVIKTVFIRLFKCIYIRIAA